MSRFVISGAKGGMTSGADAPNRLEIHDLVKNETQFSLYIQALAAMSAKSQTDQLSTFQVGGIHGLPYTQWDGSGGDQPVPGSSWGGYCTHGSVLFPTWHRPYVALLEQLLQQHAVEIAKQYSDHERWSVAAANFRAPYWDWASNMLPPPEVISMEKVTILTPKGRSTVDNPLFRYKFHPIDPSFPTPYSAWKTTLRHPTGPGADATSNVNQMKRQLQAEASDIRSKTFALLSRINSWPEFSNHTSDGGNTNSLEGIHDTIHVVVGGQGHMGDPAVAGFDPIFFLHHANVDRLLSLWSALHPDTWVTPGSAVDGTFTIKSSSTVNDTTDLTPFWNTQVGYWISTQTTRSSKLGYTYPEFNGLDMSDPGRVRVAIARKVNQLYGGASPLSVSPITQFAQAPVSVGAAAPASRSTAAAADSAANPTDGKVAVEGAGPDPSNVTDKFWEWTARIRFKKYELGGSGSVLIYLGSVPENPSDWSESEYFVGAVHAFVNSVPGACENCRDQADIEIQGFVHLNEAIAKHSNLGSFDPRVVEPYLKEHLNWAVHRVDLTPIQVSDLKSLEVMVFATPLTQDPGDIFPVPGEPRQHHRITHGQEGGCNCPEGV